jgi:hypothetical protein
MSNIQHFQSLKILVGALVICATASAAQGINPLVGVIMSANGCGGSAPLQYDIYLDNEDDNNANWHSGWIGATVSNRNTHFKVCAVDGNLFTPAAVAGARFALLALSPSCPSSFTYFERFHDNEDNDPASWDNMPLGSPTKTIGGNTNMAFCVATGTNPNVANTVFPSLGISYGVFGGRTEEISLWAIGHGSLRLDDEDKNNHNAPVGLPVWTGEFVTGGRNTDYFLARIR